MRTIFIAFSILLVSCASQAKNDGPVIVQCANSSITFFDTCWKQMAGIQFLHVHENETTAVQAIYDVLGKQNTGCFVTWHSQKDRYISFDVDGKHFKFDPNRIYSAIGLEATLKKNGDYSTKAFDLTKIVAQKFLHDFIDNRKLLVAVHNNTDAEWTVHSTIAAGETSDSYINPNLDEDDFILVTERNIFNFFKDRKFNVVLQKEGIPDDGSLSVYAANKKIPYINIEAQMGHLEQQKQMLEAVLQLIKEQYQ